MARTVPALPATPPDPLAFPPFGVVLAGELRRLAQAINLAQAVGRQGPVFAQWWNDNQFSTVDFGGGVFRLHGEVRIPVVSTIHTTITVRAYCRSVSGLGVVRVTNTAGTNYDSAAVGAAYGWVTVTAAFAVNTALGFELIQIRTSRDILVLTIQAAWNLPVGVAGLWPGAAGALSAVPDGLFVPVDDLEAAADEPLSSDLVRKMAVDLTHVEARPRMILACTELVLVDTPTGNDGLTMVFRRALPVDYRGTEVTVHLKATNLGAADVLLLVQVGGGGKDPPYEAQDLNRGQGTVASLTVPVGAAGDWFTTTFVVRDVMDAIYQAPLRYPGFTTFSVSRASSDLIIESFSVWG